MEAMNSFMAKVTTTRARAMRPHVRTYAHMGS